MTLDLMKWETQETSQIYFQVGYTTTFCRDLDDDSITVDKLASASVTNAKVSNSTLDASTKLTGTLGISQGGSGLTSLGTAGHLQS